MIDFMSARKHLTDALDPDDISVVEETPELSLLPGQRATLIFTPLNRYYAYILGIQMTQFASSAYQVTIDGKVDYDSDLVMQDIGTYYQTFFPVKIIRQNIKITITNLDISPHNYRAGFFGWLRKDIIHNLYNAAARNLPPVSKADTKILEQYGATEASANQEVKV